MIKLNLLVNQLETNIQHLEKSNLDVSKATVGWHIEHSLLTINGIIFTLSKSNPADYKWTFNLLKIVVFMVGKFPRGKAKAPKLVIPTNEITVESLQKHIAKTRVKIQELGTIKNDNFFKHPYFGNLKKQQTIKFLGIHTKHHLAIVRDILNANNFSRSHSRSAIRVFS